MTLQVTIDPTASLDGDAVCFQMGPGSYETLRDLWEDITIGKPLPLRLVTRGCRPVNLVAMAVYLDRRLSLMPQTAAFVAGVDIIDRWGLPGHAHVPADVSQFVTFLARVVGAPSDAKDAVSWIQDYLIGDTLPAMGLQEPPEVRILDQGTNGFVVAQTDGDTRWGWVELWRLGHLRGILIGPDQAGRRPAVVARKSPWVPLDLPVAVRNLNALEAAYGELTGWTQEDDLFVTSPGTAIPVSQIVEILVRV